MKLVKLVLTLAAVVGMAAGAYAQDLAATTGTVNIPYEFVVNGKVMPAGTYTIEAEPGNPGVLHIASADARGQYVKLLLSSHTDADPNHMKIVFQQNGEQHILARIDTPAGSAKF